MRSSWRRLAGRRRWPFGIECVWREERSGGCVTIEGIGGPVCEWESARSMTGELVKDIWDGIGTIYV
jgi:hypothetical protein